MEKVNLPQRQKPTLTSSIGRLIKGNNIWDIIRQEGVSFEKCLQRTEPNFAAVGRQRDVQALVAIVVESICHYFGKELDEGTRLEMATSILTRKDWSVMDALNLYQFMRNNAHKEEFKTYGAINLQYFDKIMTLYEEEKADIRVIMTKMKEDNEPILHMLMRHEEGQKILKRVAAQKAKPEKPKIDFFDPIQHEAHFEQIKAIIGDFTPDEKESYRKAIYNYTLMEDTPQAKRREELLKLLETRKLT